MTGDPVDPFGTERLRAAVLAAWADQPARFREDANAEEDHGRGYYRDRVVVELAQNAADAATRAGVAGRLLLRLTRGPAGPALVAANTGTPLDAAGAASLASLRASAKREGGSTVGRFGVGFAAVRSVSDEIAVTSAAGAVHFSTTATAEALRSSSVDLAQEVAARGRSLPILRLPFAGAGTHATYDGPVADWDTVVVLALRDDAAVAEVRRQLAGVGDPLLLALPALTSVEVHDGDEYRVVADVADRWVVARRTGTHPPNLLVDRPVEERDRTGWQVTWAAPRPAVRPGSGPTAEAGGWPVHAPTPTEEPCTLPALLVATFPLDPSRRHVAAGSLTDALVEEAGRTWGDLLAACRDAPEGPDPLDLLPSGLPAGRLDAALREAGFEAARTIPMLRPVDGGPALPASQAVVLVGRDAHGRLDALARWLPGLVDLAPRHRHLVRALGIAETELSEVVDALPATTPAAHRDLYDAFATASGATLEELATLPVPLLDGRVVRGARGLVVLDDVDLDVATVLVEWGLRIVHPDAAHPLLERLGASRADSAALLRHPAVGDRAVSEPDAADVVLTLLASAVSRSGAVEPEPWWGDVLLPAVDGELLPARGLVVAGSDAARWFDPEVLPPVADEAVARWGDLLPALGVRTGLSVVHVDPALLAPDLGGGTTQGDRLVDELDGWAEYVDELTGGGELAHALTGAGEIAVVADLDAVRTEAWPAVLAVLTGGPARRALVEPVRLLDGDRPSYTAWWLRNRSGLGLEHRFADAGGRPWLAGLLPAAPDLVRSLDEEVRRALGGVVSPAELDGDGWADVLDALPPVGEPFALSAAAGLWRALARFCVGEAAELDLDRLPALVRPAEVAVVPIYEVAVADPLWVQHPGGGPVIVVPTDVAEMVADALDVDLAAERAAGVVSSSGHEVPTPAAVLAVFPGAPPTWLEHDHLEVDGRQLDWWVDDRVHAATTSGLAAGLAHALGWRVRAQVERLLQDPTAVDDVVLDLAGQDLGGVGSPDGPA